MAALFDPKFQLAWAVVLAVLLFFPAKRLIFVLAVRRAEKKHGPTDGAARAKLARRTAWTAGLLCFVFSYLYTAQLFRG
jgi:hypothetical protein